MNRVEAVIFAFRHPGRPRDARPRRWAGLQRIELIIDDIREELRGRPFDLVAVAGGWHHRTKSAYAPAIRASGSATQPMAGFNQQEAMVLIAIGYYQPVTRGELSSHVRQGSQPRYDCGPAPGKADQPPVHAARRRARPTPT
jgi:segregation and condensation protein B